MIEQNILIGYDSFLEVNVVIYNDNIFGQTCEYGQYRSYYHNDYPKIHSSTRSGMIMRKRKIERIIKRKFMLSLVIHVIC